MERTVLGGTVTIDETFVEAPTAAIDRFLATYEAGEAVSHDLPIAYPDSFTGRVMREMATIPPGETRTYGDVAAALDTAPIAVGRAAGRNPIPILVPCHRVVATDSLGGYSGTGGVAQKRRLLAHEGVLDDHPDRG
ncbi:MAG: methylated-DNA--[protein]-cysteine S-methyltransferase [Halanaeroarchaeum sp.]